MFVKERQPVFQTLIFATSADRLIEWVRRPARTEFDAIVLAEARDGLFVQNDFGHGGKFDQIKLVRGALTDRIKAPCAIQNIAEQIKTDRTAFARREDIDDAAANGVVTGLHHGRGLNKAHAHKEIPKRGFIHTVANTRRERSFAQNGTCRQPLGCRVQCREQHEFFGHAVHQPSKGRHACGRNIGVRRHTIKRQTVPPRERHNGHVGGKKGQGLLHMRQALGVARDVDHGAARPFDLFQHQTGIKALGCAAHKDWCVLCHTG